MPNCLRHILGSGHAMDLYVRWRAVFTVCAGFGTRDEGLPNELQPWHCLTALSGDAPYERAEGSGLAAEHGFNPEAPIRIGRGWNLGRILGRILGRCRDDCRA
jgi:hypothetical protein